MRNFTMRFRRSALGALFAMLVLAAGCGQPEPAQQANTNEPAPEMTPTETVAPAQPETTPAPDAETAAAGPLVPGQENKTLLVFGETYKIDSVTYDRTEGLVSMGLVVTALKAPDAQYDLFVHLVRGDGEVYGVPPSTESAALPTEAGQQATLTYAINMTPERNAAGLTGLRFGLFNVENQNRMHITTPDPRLEEGLGTALIKF